MTKPPAPDFALLFDALPGLYLVLLPDEPNFTIVAVNRAYAEATLTNPQEIIGRGLFEVFPDDPEDPAATGVRNARHSLHEVLATKARHTMHALRYAIRRPEAQGGGFEERYWSPSNSPVLNDQGEVKFIVHRVEDVTELVKLRRTETGKAVAVSGRAAELEAELFLSGMQHGESQRLLRERTEIERQLRAMEDRYALAFSKAPAGMVLLTPDGRILDVNQAYVDFLGYSRDELMARDSSRFTHPEDVELTVNFFASLQSGERGTRSIEKRYFRKGGEILWARASATMRRDAHGKPAEVIAIVEDITERKLAQERLWASQAHLRAIYDGTYEYIGLLSPDGIVLDCNRASLQFAGSTREDLIGKRLWDTSWFADTPGAPERLKAGVARAAAGEFVRYEAPLIRPSGEVRTFDFSIHPVRNERGEVAFLVPEGRDITEGYRAAQQIEEDRRRWRELLRQTPAGIALLRGRDHRFEWVNPVYEELVGRSAETLAGKPVLEVVPEVRGQVYLDILDGVYTSGTPFVGHESPIRLDRGDGVLHDLYLNFVYLPTRGPDGEVDGIFVHVTDVTATVNARKQIEDSERQFRTLAEAIPHLAWMADATGDIFWYNQRWFDYTGTTLEDVSGWGWEKVHDPAVLPEVKSRWQQALSNEEAFDMVFPLKGADGLFRPFLTRVEPVRDAEGRVVRWFGTNTDITAQQETEEQLRRMNRELEEFAYVASHDLQEPLRMVNIYTQMILQQRGADPAELDQFGRYVREGVERMVKLIQDLLTFSRTVHSDEKAPPGKADLQTALDEALSVLKDRIAECGGKIEAAELPVVRGDGEQITHVFQNILSNALKYRKADEAPLIAIGAERNDSQWVVWVRDNGIGFEQEYAEKIFGLFKRLHKNEYPGTGLGLAICTRIVERCGGRMWAEGRPGKGATFYFSLPDWVE